VAVGQLPPQLDYPLLPSLVPLHTNMSLVGSVLFGGLLQVCLRLTVATGRWSKDAIPGGAYDLEGAAGAGSGAELSASASFALT
jgi:hypothetical protein